MSLIYQSDILTTLAYLMGERSVNATTSAPRADFIQQTLEDTYSAFPWRFARALVTLTISNGIATLPTDFSIDHPFTTTWFNGTTETSLDEIDASDRKAVQNGNNAVWVTSPVEDTYVLNTKDTTPVAAIVQYQKRPPVLDAANTIGTAYPSKMTIALGARRFVKLGQNPDADISQDEKIFSNRLAADIASEQVPAPRRSRRSRQGQIGAHTGEF